MRKISRSTFYYKKVSPCIAALFLIIMFTIAVLPTIFSESNDYLLSFIILVILSSVAGWSFFWHKSRVWPLVDEVLDKDDYLQFRKGNKKQRVALKDITNISYTESSLRTITVYTKNEGDIGTELPFLAKLSVKDIFLTKNPPIFLELLERFQRESSSDLEGTQAV